MRPFLPIFDWLLPSGARRAAFRNGGDHALLRGRCPPPASGRALIQGDTWAIALAREETLSGSHGNKREVAILMIFGCSGEHLAV